MERRREAVTDPAATDRKVESASPLPYGRQWITDEDIAAVVDVLRSEWLTTGPTVERLEGALGQFVEAREVVAVSSGTAALHGAMFALRIGPGDEVIVPAMTFAASANCVVYQGGRPVFADVDPLTLLVDAASVERLITPRTKAIVAVDYAGQPCDYDALGAIARARRLAIVADACHALGGRLGGRPVGSLADLSAFSFHPVKHITSGEGGAVTTDDPELARRIRRFRNHGITTDHRQREVAGSWWYEMAELGYNYRLTDFQCALAHSQLSRLPAWLARRREIARRYDAAFANHDTIHALATRGGVSHAYHLYVVRLRTATLRGGRAAVFAALRKRGIGVNVHYIPVHLHPFYCRTFGTGPGLCPIAEAAYEEILSLPMFPRMIEKDVDRVITAMSEAVEELHA